MRIRVPKRFLPVVIVGVLLLAMVPAVAAYEAHVVNVKVRVEQPPTATRTLGFWQTHLDYTEHVFDDYLNNNNTDNINIGWRNIYNISELMCVFWANTAKNADDTDRSELCKARLKTSRQALAAILSNTLNNGAPMPVSISDIRNILNSSDVNAINELGALLDLFNNSGHHVPIEDSYPIGFATPGLAEAIADVTGGFADCP